MFAHIGPEALLVALALLLALIRPQLCAGWFETVERFLANVARRRTLSVLVCGLTPLAIRLAILPWLPVPRPFFHDEFSYLLAADTFAHGRLANPPHPMWLHFETFHVIFHPTYASMYAPLYGMVLAFGQVVFGHPFWGVWLSVGMMCAAFCWMLQAWLPASWALLGGILPALRFGVFSYWDNGYWGGSLTATGGALVLGALPRILRYQRVRDAVVMAVGIAMLANTRPYEGMVLTLTVAAGLVFWFLRKNAGARLPSSAVLLRRLVLPLSLVLGIAAAGTGYYFWKVTGNPLRMPQQLNRETYAVAKYFYWQKPYPEPTYHNQQMRQFYEGLELHHVRTQSSARGILLGTIIKIGSFWSFYIGPALTVPLFFTPFVRERRIRFLLIATGVCLVGNALVAFYGPHYSAPVAAAIVAIVVQGMRYLRTWRVEANATGLFLARAIIAIVIIMIPIELHTLRAPPIPHAWRGNIGDVYVAEARQSILNHLSVLPDRQLVLVRYRTDHDLMAEWVYNDADIDHAKVVWARDLGPDQNEELLHYYSSRRIWLLEPDEAPPKLTPYVPNEDQKPLTAEHRPGDVQR
jgi:hypothetical protein